VLTSYVVVFLSPATGIHMMLESEGPTALIGNWRGWLGHKNFAGAVAAVCILLFLFDAKRFPIPVRVGVIVVAGIFLYQSQSKTSAGMLILASLAGLAFVTLTHKARAYLIPILTLLMVVIWFLTSFYKNLLQASFADPASFTGRGNIWAALLRYANDNLMTGAGFGSFWNVGSLSPIYKYGSGYVTQITIGHSGFLDQLVTVGLPGMLLMVFAVMIWPLWKLLSNPALPAERGGLIAALTLFCIGHNITESSLFERDAIVATLLYFAAALAQYCTVPDGYMDKGKGGDEALFRAMRERRNALAAAD
jgi:O-antigen ligase